MSKTNSLSSSLTLAALALATFAGPSHASLQIETVATPVPAATAATLAGAAKEDRVFELARRGADDPAGDDRGRNRGGGKRGRGGHDDPPGHG